MGSVLSYEKLPLSVSLGSRPSYETSVCTALIFPGQGSQDPAMGADVHRWTPELVEPLEDLVGPRPFTRVEESTRLAQPALFCAGVAAWRALEASGVIGDVLAGHSVGDFAALTVSGALNVSDGLRLVAARGQITDSVAENDGCGMLALLGADRDQAERLATLWGLYVAIDNAPGQVVLAGNQKRFAHARAESRRLGLRAVELAVKGAFHSPVMRAAVSPFLDALATVRFREPSTPVYSSATAQPFDDIPRRLTEGLTSVVRWREVLRALHDLNIERFIEAGPGEVLTQLVRRSFPDVAAMTLSEALGKATSHRRAHALEPRPTTTPLLAEPAADP